jgi:hypothetical protein
MGKHVAGPEPTRPTWEQCGAIVTLYWDGWYQAACTRPKGHAAYHGDGVTDEKHDAYVKRIQEEVQS